MSEQSRKQKRTCRHGGNRPPAKVRKAVPKDESRARFAEKNEEYERFALPWFLPGPFFKEDGKVKIKPGARQWVRDLYEVPSLAEEYAHVRVFKCTLLSKSARDALFGMVYSKFANATTEQEKKDGEDFAKLVNDYVASVMKDAAETLTPLDGPQDDKAEIEQIGGW